LRAALGLVRIAGTKTAIDPRFEGGEKSARADHHLAARRAGFRRRQGEQELPLTISAEVTAPPKLYSPEPFAGSWDLRWEVW
jgi:hypothetical protein